MFKFCNIRKAKPEPEKPAPCPEKTVSKAAEISSQYDQLSRCCDLLASLKRCQKPETADTMMARAHDIYTGGWPIRLWTVENAGIDPNEIYKYIENLVDKKRRELEASLARYED